MSKDQKNSSSVPIKLLVFIVLVLVVGVIYLSRKQNSTISTFPHVAQGAYRSTTLGFKLTLPSGWGVSEMASGSPGTVSIDPLNMPGDSYTITTAKFHLFRSDQILSRGQSEAFIDWVKRIDQVRAQSEGVVQDPSQPEFKVNDIHNVAENIQYKVPGSPSLYRHILYLDGKSSSKETYIISNTINADSAKIASDDPNLKTIAAGVQSIPVTTGDIMGQMFAQKFVKNISSTSGTLKNFLIPLFKQDQKTIVTKTRTDNKGAYVFHLKPGNYLINDQVTGWHSFIIAPGTVQQFIGGIFSQ